MTSKTTVRWMRVAILIAALYAFFGCGDLTGVNAEQERAPGRPPTGRMRIVLCPLTGCPDPPMWTETHPDTVDTEEVRRD
ncbi:MAG: hypothetical protein ACYS5V_00555 [Planctomycetota bacterium]|jgi:hypothetical protein